jgi:hypothetical protein
MRRAARGDAKGTLSALHRSSWSARGGRARAGGCVGPLLFCFYATFDAYV